MVVSSMSIKRTWCISWHKVTSVFWVVQDDLERAFLSLRWRIISLVGKNFSRVWLLNAILSDWESRYGIQSVNKDLGLRFQRILRAAHEKTGLGCVVLIDEYDKPILDVLDLDYQVEHLGKMITLEEKHRNIMKSFYTTFKGADADLRFVFLTGVTKFSQISMFSGFNQPDDISLNRNYETICGITKEELTKYSQTEI